MPNYETTGGGKLQSGDKSIVRKVVVTTDGTDPVAPELSAPLTSVSISEEAGGVRRGVFEYTTAEVISGNSSYNIYGKRVELMGGTREAPIQAHPYFQTLTEQQIAQVETQIENRVDDFWWTTNKDGDPFTEKQQVLYNFLRRGIEYALTPSVVGRVSEIESALPQLLPLGKVADPPELKADPYTFWICTAISATPVGNRYEVTREYTLSYAYWTDIETLYGWKNGE